MFLCFFLAEIFYSISVRFHQILANIIIGKMDQTTILIFWWEVGTSPVDRAVLIRLVSLQVKKQRCKMLVQEQCIALSRLWHMQKQCRRWMSSFFSVGVFSVHLLLIVVVVYVGFKKWCVSMMYPVINACWCIQMLMIYCCNEIELKFGSILVVFLYFGTIFLLALTTQINSNMQGISLISNWI